MEGQPSFRTLQTVVFDLGGRDCTEIALTAAVRRAVDLRLEHILVASTGGGTARQLLSIVRRDNFPGQVVVVGVHTGYHSPGVQTMSTETRRELEASGAVVFIGTHAFAGIARSFRQRWGGLDTGETVAEAFRRISRGTKVCCEMAVMAADANLVPTDRDVVAVGGSGGGADTAIVVRPATMNCFFDLKVREFICMPRLRVEEVLKPVIDRSREGASPDTIAAELGIDPGPVFEYARIYHQVTHLVASGASLEKAVAEATGGRKGEFGPTFIRLYSN